MKKLILLLAIIVLAIAVILFVFKDNVAKSAIQKEVGSLGVPISIGIAAEKIAEVPLEGVGMVEKGAADVVGDVLPFGREKKPEEETRSENSSEVSPKQ